MSLRDQLQEIYDRRGELTPALVVEEARDEQHPLHARFEWDDATAGEAWRRQQAHELIRSVRVVYKEADETSPEKSVRAFHAVRSDRGHTYEPVERVVEDDFTRQLVIRDMQRQWKDLYRRFKDFDEFIGMVRKDIGDTAA